MVNNNEINGMKPRRRVIDWDVRGILAVLSVIGVFGLATAQLSMGGNAEVPAWAATLVGAVAGFYFGSRGGSNGNGNGTH